MDRKKNRELTRISGHNQTKIMDEDMSAGEIVAFLESGAIYRSFRDILEKVYPSPDLKKVLTERLTELTGGNRESIARNVRNWLDNGKNLPQRRQLFQICFALNLDERQASQVLASASETGIHYRNPEELVYAYCLRKGESWQRAQELVKELEPVWKKSQEAENLPTGKPGNPGKADGKADRKADGKADRKADGKAPRGSAETSVLLYTRQIQHAFFRKVNSEDELRAFFEEYGGMLGEIHETAYREFIRMLELLQNPDEELRRETEDYVREYRGEFSDNQWHKIEERRDELRQYSIKEILDTYFQMHVPANTTRKKGEKAAKPERDYTYLQKVIRKNWPSENILAKMRAREIDVSRKVLLLLFLITEEFEAGSPDGMDGEDDYLDELDEAEDAGEMMELRLMQMNLFLEQFGMNRLDPGNAFDCLVLYALRASFDDDEGMGDRLSRTLEFLFSDRRDDSSEI